LVWTTRQSLLPGPARAARCVLRAARR